MTINRSSIPTKNSTKSPQTNQLQTFRISGMDCAGCAQSLEKAVAGLDHVESSDVSFTTELLRVQGDASPESIVSCVRSMGFDVVEPEDDEASAEPAPQNFWQYMWARLETRCALFAALLMMPGLVLHELLGREALWMDVTSLAAMGLAGWPIARSAWRALRNRQITINVLMTVAALGAAIIGAFAEAGMVLVLFALGEALEGYTGSRSRHAIRSLMEVAPQMALRIATVNGSPRTQEEQEVHIRELAVGDTILVKPGERIPMDGRVLAGESAVNQAAITGESRPIDKAPGADVFAGSINGEGTLTLRVTTLAEDNTISRVIAMVEEAQERKAPAQRFVDRFAQRYTPAVMVLAVAVAVLPPLLLGQPFLNPDPNTFGWLYRGLALLVVACPCALVISTPVSIISAIANGARHGVLFKGGAHVEALSRVRCVALDKTGTLTQGAPTVVTVHASNCRDKMRLRGTSEQTSAQTVDEECAECVDVLALASAVERYSEHPLAKAIVAASEEQGVGRAYPPAQAVRALPGRGVTGTVDGQELLVGSHAYFDQHIQHAADRCTDAAADAARGYTPMLLSVDGTYRGTITVADALRPSSADAVRELRHLGLEHVVMLTGDHASTAAALAESVGIDDVRAELLPGDKLDAVRSLEQECGMTAMVGDGINDAPALAAASVGIAMGGATSSAQAMETADITLMSDDLRQLPFAVRLSRAAMRTIRTNVLLSIGIKLVFLVLVLLGWGTLWMAVLADMGTSVLVTLNGMRLLRRPVLGL